LQQIASYSITSSARAKSPQDWVLGYGLWVLVVIAVIARPGRVGQPEGRNIAPSPPGRAPND
jgi:hypothetical protein